LLDLPEQRPCPHFTPIGHDGTHGFCVATEHRVYREPRLLCLCDFCTPGQGEQRVISKDVLFLSNGTIDLKSARAARLAAAIEQAAPMPCAPKSAPKPAPAAPAKPKKSQAPAPARKPGLLGFV
ncbi:MAG: hypothetical protein GYA24_10210, partial [Candidatus Lokiarchaeota archaeon]|nr:hypothetical protein [Candidatus Lokiarchaeota archaeon]